MSRGRRPHQDAPPPRCAGGTRGRRDRRARRDPRVLVRRPRPLPRCRRRSRAFQLRGKGPLRPP